MSSPEEVKREGSQPPSEQAAASDSDELLDWDARLEEAPPRPSGKIKVRLRYRGRGLPIPVDVTNGDSPKT
jgi:hypothetical protein